MDMDMSKSYLVFIYSMPISEDILVASANFSSHQQQIAMRQAEFLPRQRLLQVHVQLYL